MDLKNSVLNRLFQDEVSTKKTAMNRFTEKLWKFAKDKISTHYGYNCQIDDEYMISIVNNFIKTYDPKFESRNMSENNLLCNTAIFLTLDINTFMYVIAGNPSQQMIIQSYYLSIQVKDQSLMEQDLRFIFMVDMQRNILDYLSLRFRRRVLVT